ncbi:MAG: hypothetical protein ACOX88_08065 [Christensenellales bacterium]|jgi:hypothetical protein
MTRLLDNIFEFFKDKAQSAYWQQRLQRFLDWIENSLRGVGDSDFSQTVSRILKILPFVIAIGLILEWFFRSRYVRFVKPQDKLAQRFAWWRYVNEDVILLPEEQQDIPALDQGEADDQDMDAADAYEKLAGDEDYDPTALEDTGEVPVVGVIIDGEEIDDAEPYVRAAAKPAKDGRASKGMGDINRRMKKIVKMLKEAAGNLLRDMKAGAKRTRQDAESSGSEEAGGTGGVRAHDLPLEGQDQAAENTAPEPHEGREDEQAPGGVEPEVEDVPDETATGQEDKPSDADVPAEDETVSSEPEMEDAPGETAAGENNEESKQAGAAAPPEDDA